LNEKLVILIVSPPGDLQIGLQALLTVHLDVDVLVVGEGSSALKVIERQFPAVVILDHNLPGDVAPKIIHDIKTNWPEIICIVLVNDENGRQSFLDTGADLIAIKGLPGAKLVAEIKRLLNMNGFDRPLNNTSKSI
jgi:DNA-binding response OmpR family regulator